MLGTQLRNRVFQRAARFIMADDGSVKAKVIRSGFWVGLGSICASGLGVIRSIVLARLLAPEMFGLMGLAGIAMRTMETVTRPGIAQALIARQQTFDQAAGTGFALLVVRGFLLTVMLALVAPWVALFYEEPELEPVLQVLALVFCVGSFANISTIARQKELDFRRLTFLNLATTVLGTLGTITAAVLLRNVWALVIGQLASTVLHVLLSYRLIPGRLRFEWNSVTARELLAYGKFVTGSSIVLFAANEIDSAVLGKMLGMEQLGYYAFAFTIAQMATSNVSRTASGIMMPAYSKLQTEPEALRRAYLRTLNLVMYLVLPLSVALAILAEPIVRLVYGEKWMPAVVPLQIFAFFGLVRTLNGFSGYLFEGTGRPHFAFRLGVLRLAVIAPLIVPMTAALGLRGAAVTVLLGVAVQCCAVLWYLSRHLGIRLTEVAHSIARPTWTTIIMAAVVAATMAGVGRPDLLQFAGIVGAGLGSYLLVNWKVFGRLRDGPLS